MVIELGWAVVSVMLAVLILGVSVLIANLVWWAITGRSIIKSRWLP